MQPDFYFNTKKEKDSILRQIVTEGLATYLATKILGVSDGDALWADYISDKELEKWMKLCFKEEKKLFFEFFKLIQNNESNSALFYANNPNNIREYRVGYFVGLEVIKKILNNNYASLKDLMFYDQSKFKQLILDILSN